MTKYLLLSVSQVLYDDVRARFEEIILNLGLVINKNEGPFWHTAYKGKSLFSEFISDKIQPKPIYLRDNVKYKSIDKFGKKVCSFENENFVIPFFNFLGIIGRDYTEKLDNFLSDISSKKVSNEEKEIQRNPPFSDIRNNYIQKTRKIVKENFQPKQDNPVVLQVQIAQKDYLLTYFEILELLCRIKFKWDKIINPGFKPVIKNMDSYTPQGEELVEFLKDCTIEYSESFLTAIGQVSVNNYQILYEMKLAIEDGKSMFFSKIELKLLCGYLWGPKFIFKNKYKPFEPARVSEKMSMFEGTCWLVYYDAFIHEPANEHTLGIAMMEFSSFGNVKYKSLNRELTGHYYTYDKNEDYLIVNLTQINTHKLHRRFIIYCGASRTEIMLGQYTYLEEITSANVFMEYTNEKYNRFKGKYITQHLQEFQKIHPSIQQYFLGDRLGGTLSSKGKKEYSHLSNITFQQKKS